jgi:hypothetical protein
MKFHPRSSAIRLDRPFEQRQGQRESDHQGGQHTGILMLQKTDPTREPAEQDDEGHRQQPIEDCLDYPIAPALVPT